MRDRHVFDVSPCVYTGTYAPYQREVPLVMNLPVGGIRFTLRRIVADLCHLDVVACAFDYSSNSNNSKLDGYKATRQKDPKIVVQSDFLYEMLRDCNVPCYRGFGEADDHVFGLVKSEVNNLVPELNRMFIHSSDYDLAHNVHERGVELRAINSNINNVNYGNFSEVMESFEKTKIKIPFNTISAFKVCFYDKSDNIKTLKLKSLDPKDLYEAYCLWLSKKGYSSSAYTTSKNLFTVFCEAVVKDKDDLKLIKDRIETIYPKDLSDKVGGYHFGDKSSVNMKLLTCYAFVLKDKVSLSTLAKAGYRSDTFDNDPNGYIALVEDKIKNYGVNFKQGVYSVDNNLSVTPCNVFGDKVSVRREF